MEQPATAQRGSAPISVVIPAFNAAATLPETLKSVASQTLPVAEVVVVDDGSSDTTAEIADSFGAIVIRQANTGIPGARNAGVGAASQPWIALLDADDIWHPRKIERQWEAHLMHPEIGFIVCDTTVFDSTSGEVTTPSVLAREGMGYAPLCRIMIDPSIALFEQIEPDFHSVGMFLLPSAALIRKAELVGAGLFAPLQAVEDCECFLRVLRNTGLLVIEEPLMRYRVHSNNLSHDSLRMLIGYIEMAKLMIAEPDRYARGAADSAASALPSRLTSAATLLLKEGRSSEARQMLRERLRLGPSTYASVLLVMTILPRWLVRTVLAIKRFLRLRRRKAK